jgi:23S rRNA (adenine2503-C2)-methyltransferase
MKELGDARLTNIVFMGMGEPLDNYDNVVKSVGILQELFLFSPRKITVSTCGIVPKIELLALAGLKVKLAVSLNSAIQEKREMLMPVAVKYPLDELKNSLLTFKKKNPFRITFEYIMIKDLNMGTDDLKALIRFLGDISCKLNLIKWNPVPGLPYKSPTDREIESFRNKLMTLDSAVTYRKS